MSNQRELEIRTISRRLRNLTASTSFSLQEIGSLVTGTPNYGRALDVVEDMMANTKEMASLSESLFEALVILEKDKAAPATG